MAIELREYKYSSCSHYGYIWESIGIFPDQDSADQEIIKRVETGTARTNLKTKEVVDQINTPEPQKPLQFYFRKRPANWDMPHSERRRRWNSSDNREKI